MLEISDLTVHYGQALALERIDVSVPDKGLTAIIGPNGAGKTTALKTISGLVKPTRGSITFNGESLLQYKPHTIAKMGIAHCPEGRKPFPEMTVLENLLIGAYLLPRLKIGGRLEFVFDLFPVLKQRRRQYAGTLSGGEQQMMAIARALMSDPSLLLIDEPSLGLSPIIAEEVEKITENVKEKGLSVLMVEGNFDLIGNLADKIYVFDHGNSVFCGKMTDLTNNTNLSKTYLGM